MKISQLSIKQQASRLRACCFVMPLLLLVAFPSFADKIVSGPCNNVSRTALQLFWVAMRSTGDDLFCRKSWAPNRADELMACGLIADQYSEVLNGKWNTLIRNVGTQSGAKVPRSFGASTNTRVIQGGARHLFFGMGLAATKSTVEIHQESPDVVARVTVCQWDHSGHMVLAQQMDFQNRDSTSRQVQTIALENKNTHLIGMIVDARTNAKPLQYRTELTTHVRDTMDPVKGIADLHVHQLANLGFGGRLFWGLHAGEKQIALAPEIVTGRYKSSRDTKIAQAMLGFKKGLDANVALSLASPKITDEGFFRVGGGGFPHYKEWPHHADRSHQQVHIDWVKEAHERERHNHSNLSLMVVSVVNNDVLCKALKFVDPHGNVPTRNSAGEISGWESAGWGCSDFENVNRQLQAIHALEKSYPWYRVALNPGHARQIIRDGNLAVVIALETDKPLSDVTGSSDQWLKRLDAYRAMGLTTMQVVHESNSIFCGAATHRNMMQVVQLLRWPGKSMLNLLKGGSTFSRDARGYNTLGITTEGEKLVDGLVQRNLPIDLAHGGEKCRKGIMKRVPTGYGLYDSHTKFERLLKPGAQHEHYGTAVLERENEFLITESLLADYVKHKVLVGLRTASVDVYDAPNSQVKNTCPGSARSYAQLIQYAQDSGLEFAYGTDFNTGVSQLGPRFGDSRCFAYRVSELRYNKNRKKHRSRPASDHEPLTPEVSERINRTKKIDNSNYYLDGLAHIGWLPELTEDLINLGTPGAEKLRDSAEAYLRMWERAQGSNRSASARTINNVHR